MSEMWDAVAGAWEREADRVDAHMAAATEAMLDAAGVGPGTRVLDLACGPGGAGLAAAARTGADGAVVLADVAPEMVAAAARRAAGRPGVTTMVCDELAIASEDDAFDAVLVRHGLMFAPEPADAVREAVRVLRPGGRYAAMTWGPRTGNPWLGLVFDAVGAQFGVEFPPPGVAGPFALDDPARLHVALTDGGLSGVAVDEIATPMRAASLDDWWDAVVATAGPLATALAGMEPEVRATIRRRGLDMGAAVARTTGEGIELDGVVLVAYGAA